MTEYRLYFLTNGRIARAMNLVCESDAQAKARAEEKLEGGEMELWSGPRIVARFPDHSEA
jgi:hypothetical protein